MMRGPRALKTDGNAIAFLTGATRTIAGWYRGAKRKRKGDVAATVGIEDGASDMTGQPSDMRMSADPEDDVAARLPCCSEVVSWPGFGVALNLGLTLYTRHPAPAATIPEVVETLKVLWPSPPVPTMSHTGPVPCSPTSTLSACRCITSAHAATTEGSLSLPVRCSAARKAPIWDGCAPAGAARW